jgi:RHS repeat-associated protein
VILLAEHDEPPILAVKKKRQLAPLKTATSTPKNRVWGFANTPSGRLNIEAGSSWENATGSVQYTYQNASGRAEWLSRDPMVNPEVGQGPNLYDYVHNDPVRFIDPLGLWTGSVGVTVNFQIGPVNINFSAGVAVDGQGNVGTTYVAGGGLGVGAHASGGVSFAGSNAKTICDLSGPFANFNAGGGLGPDVEGNAWTGGSPDGQVTGGGVTIGVGAGGGGSGGGTYTWVNPVGKL